MNSSPTRPDYSPETAFLVVQNGAARVEVVELTTGGRVTVGRAASNRIVLTDKKCSRMHCEVFRQSGHWYVRDLESRNGISVNGESAKGDTLLSVGDRIAIGESTLLLTDADPSEPADEDDPSYSIVERRTGTQFDLPSGLQRHGLTRPDVAELFHLGKAMHDVSDVVSLSNLVLDKLLTTTPAVIGAVLLLEPDAAPITRNLQIVASQSRTTESPRQFSDYLSSVVLSEKDALLAHDIRGHEFLSQRDSIEQLKAESAVCAPIRVQDRVLGVIHLYATEITNPLTVEHLEFTLAVSDQMAGLIDTFRERDRLVTDLSIEQSRGRELREQLELESELIGTSAVMSQVRSAIRRVAPTDATVLIRGESGVGKELVARAVHFNSHRKEGPFVCVNCAALTESLLESELFGHEKGAFTGASAQKAGKFEQADSGTIFLDEVGEMSPEVQSKFLRVLEGQSFERVGGDREIVVDVRVVTATNRNLEEAVRQGKFRSDLFFRLQVIEIVAPPLRDHPEDIPQLAKYFVDRFTKKSRSRVKGFGRPAIDKLVRHSWPGNVRELRNVIERAVILSDREVLAPDDIVLTRLEISPQMQLESGAPVSTDPPTELGDGQTRETHYDPQVNLWGSLIQQSLTLDDIERLYMDAVLKHCDWNKSQASRVLGIERTTLDRRLKRYGMHRPDGAGDDSDSDRDETT
jgi:transcriptional regulator with GAF, ATPase, and Fis domain